MWLWLMRAKTQNLDDIITIDDVDVDVEESDNGRLATAWQQVLTVQAQFAILGDCFEA